MAASAALALLAGLFFALAASLQQRAARSAAISPPTGDGFAAALPIVTVMRRLVRDRIWLSGWLINLAGFLTQASALHYGSVALVQTLLVSQLLFSLPLTSMRTRLSPTLADWAAGASICIGLALFLSERQGQETSGTPDRFRVLLAAASGAALVALLLRIGTGKPAPVHAALAAVAAGLCFAMTAVLIKLTTDDLLHRGVGATALDWPGYALAATTVLGLLIGQEAYATGALPIAIATMSITNPVASYAIGVTAFGGDQVPDSAGALATFCAAGLMLAVGVVGLAHSRALKDVPSNADPDYLSSPLTVTPTG